jgi:hypothetical protein
VVRWARYAHASRSSMPAAAAAKPTLASVALIQGAGMPLAMLTGRAYPIPLLTPSTLPRFHASMPHTSQHSFPLHASSAPAKSLHQTLSSYYVTPHSCTHPHHAHTHQCSPTIECNIHPPTHDHQWRLHNACCMIATPPHLPSQPSPSPSPCPCHCHSPASAAYGSATAGACRPSCTWWTRQTLTT